MSILKTSISILLFCIAAVRPASHDKHEMSTDSQNFLKDLQHDIELCKDYRNKKDTTGYTMLRVTGKNMEFGEFYRLCKPLITITEAKEMISIITLRDLNIYGFYSEDHYFELFTNALLGYINKNEDYVMLGSLGLSVHYVDPKHLTEYDTKDAIFEQIYRYHKKLDELVMVYFYEICFDAFKDIIISLTEKYLFYYISFIIDSEQEEDRLENFINSKPQKMVEDLREVLTNNDCFKWMTRKSYVKSPAFDAIFEDICSYEAAYDLNHFTGKHYRANSFYSYLIFNRYSELFRQGINDLIERYIPLLLFDTKQACYLSVLRVTTDDLNEFYYQDNPFLGELGCDSETLANFMETQEFLDPMHKYFSEIYSKEIEKQHRSKYETKINAVCSELGQENVVKIMYIGPISNNNIRSLLNALYETRVLSKPSRDQYVYLDDKKMLSESEAHTLAAIYARIISQPEIYLQTLDFFAKTKPQTENSQASRFKKIFYKSKLSATNSDNSMKYKDAIPKSTHTEVTLYKSVDLTNESIDKSIAKKISLCLARNKSIMIDINIISISKDMSATLIYMIRHKNIDTAEVIVSLIYTVPVIKNLDDEENQKHRYGHIWCLDNVSSLLFDDLTFQLRRVQLLRSVSFTTPNIFVMGNFDLIYKGITVENGVSCGVKIDINSLPNKLYNEPKSFIHCHLTFKQIMEFEVKQTHGCKEINGITKKLGLQECELNLILLKFMPIFNTGVDVGNEPSLRYKHSKPRKITLLVTGSCEKDMVLHLCELQNYHYYHYVTYDPLKVLAKMSKTTKVKSAQDIVKAGIESYPSFFPLLCIDICNRINDLVSDTIWINRRPGTVEIVSFIYVFIENVFASYLHQNDYNNQVNTEACKIRKSELIKLQKTIRPKDIRELARNIENFLYKITKNTKVKVILIKINKSRGGSDPGTICESDEHYEDLRF